MTNVLVFAAHPDDEVLGCGGTIARHTSFGDDVNVVIVAEGATSRNQLRNRSLFETELTSLSLAANNSASLLGVKRIELLDFPDNRLDSIDLLDLVKVIEKYVKEFEPDTVYVHHSGDVNIDHRRLHQAVITACRPTPGSHVRRLFSYEVASSTEWQPPGSSFPFQPNWFVDISDQWHLKRSALEAYQSEMRPWPHARSISAIEHFARWRGSQVGVSYAEAFCLLRLVE